MVRSGPGSPGLKVFAGIQIIASSKLVKIWLWGKQCCHQSLDLCLWCSGVSACPSRCIWIQVREQTAPEERLNGDTSFMTPSDQPGWGLFSSTGTAGGSQLFIPRAALAAGLYLFGPQQSQALRTLLCSFPLCSCQFNLFHLQYEYFLQLTLPHLVTVFLTTSHIFDLLTKSQHIKNAWGPCEGAAEWLH